MANRYGATTNDVRARIAKGWKPNRYLSNMSMAYFANPADWVAPAIFPICPVSLTSSYYYEFLKGDLARDQVQRKPVYGKVDPAVMGHTDHDYHCKVDQIITGIDQIGTLDYQRSNAPASIDPRRSKVRFTTEQMRLHLDVVFAQNFFKEGVWANEYEGVASNPSGNQFLKFSDANFDPVHFFNERRREIKLSGRREPNKLALGYDAYIALTEHPDILERVKYTGSTANPAVVTRNVLAQILQIDEIVVFESTYNVSAPGMEDDMEFICDPAGALLCYATPSPAIDEPSAGYIFTWDPLGDGNYLPVLQWTGENGTHSEYIEGLMSMDMKVTSPDLGAFLSDCV